MNKDVSTERIIAILNEAKVHGWKKAKFYFMLGLPVSPKDEENKIIEYLNNIQHKTGIQLHVNIGTLYRNRLLHSVGSLNYWNRKVFDKIMHIKRNINNKRIRISYHSPFASFLEAIFSRGGNWAGDLALEAYRRGARLDAWEEHLDRDLWKAVIAESNREIEQEICLHNTIQDELDDIISLGITDKHCNLEMERAGKPEITDPCSFPCNDHCGICSKKLNVKEFKPEIPTKETKQKSDTSTHSYLFEFTKKGRSIFWGHLDLMHVIERSFHRAGLKVALSNGFNPKPKIEFASPLSLGVATFGDIFTTQFVGEANQIQNGIDHLNQFFPEGLEIQKYKKLEIQGKIKLMKFYRGSKWLFEHLDNTDTDKIEAYIRDNDLSSKFKTSRNQSFLELVTIAEKNPVQNPVKLIKSALGDDTMGKGINISRIEMYAEHNHRNIHYFDLYN